GSPLRRATGRREVPRTTGPGGRARDCNGGKGAQGVMRLWVFSDLHLEFEWTDRGHVGGLPEADVCVVAGDLKGSCAEAVHWLERMVGRSGMPCVFAPGNHEFYRNSILEGLEAGRHAAAQFPNVHLLDSSSTA